MCTPQCRNNVKFSVGSRVTILSHLGRIHYKQINQILDEIKIVRITNY